MSDSYEFLKAQYDRVKKQLHDEEVSKSVVVAVAYERAQIEPLLQAIEGFEWSDQKGTHFECRFCGGDCSYMDRPEVHTPDCVVSLAATIRTRWNTPTKEKK